MPFKTDGGGFAFKTNDAKLQTNTWGNRLSQISRHDEMVRIITYSLPDIEYVRQRLGRRPEKIMLIANAKFVAKAVSIKQEFPNIRVAIHDRVHSKIVLIEPRTIIISSANFGESYWHETSVSFHSNKAHDYYVESIFSRLWRFSHEVTWPYVPPPLSPKLRYRQRSRLVDKETLDRPPPVPWPHDTPPRPATQRPIIIFSED